MDNAQLEWDQHRGEGDTNLKALHHTIELPCNEVWQHPRNINILHVLWGKVYYKRRHKNVFNLLERLDVEVLCHHVNNMTEKSFTGFLPMVHTR